ncbi:MAG: CHAP domain-containing protein [Clostridia bacterium]|nr:CHAP domain-containing protein [Clostridia bacterium]
MKRIRLCAALLCLLFFAQPLLAAALSYTGSASYAGGRYYTALTALSLTGDPRADIVAVAQSQIGYQEGGSSSQLSGEVPGSGNCTEYGRWYGLQDMWCAMFVSWCAYNADIPTTVVPKHSFTVSGLNQFISWGRAHTRAEVAAGTYTPQAGDIIYFKSARNTNKTNHVGIVTGFSGSTIYTVEGNTSSAEISTNGGAVCAKSYSTSNTFVVYVCCPDYGGTPVTPPVSGTYFPACAQSCATITEGLANIGKDTSYAYRKRIAAANHIEEYSGTAAQNNQMLSLLKQGTLIDPDGVPEPAADCFPACAASFTTLAAALESVGADASFAYRKEIAAANGIGNYSGTVDQNDAMLALLKAGTLKKPADSSTPAVTYFTACDSSYQSLADALRSVGADGSFAYRARIAAANGIADYEGTAAQNTQMLDLLKAGRLIVPDTNAAGTCGCGSAYLEHVVLAETCTEDGAEYDRCTKCGAVSNRTVIPAAGHTYTCVTTAATCTQAGAAVYTCSCGDSYSETIPPRGHDFDASIAGNVTVADGTKTVRCSRCAACLVNTPGDVNADGHINLRDVVLLRRVLADWDVTSDPLNADVNADHVTDLRDVALIARYLAGGWGVQLQFAI